VRGLGKVGVVADAHEGADHHGRQVLQVLQDRVGPVGEVAAELQGDAAVDAASQLVGDDPRVLIGAHPAALGQALGRPQEVGVGRLEGLRPALSRCWLCDCLTVRQGRVGLGSRACVQAVVARAAMPVMCSQLAKRTAVSARWSWAGIRCRRGRKWGEMPLNADRNRWLRRYCGSLS
jgi:hypothetical protein